MNFPKTNLTISVSGLSSGQADPTYSPELYSGDEHESAVIQIIANPEIDQITWIKSVSQLPHIPCSKKMRRTSTSRNPRQNPIQDRIDHEASKVVRNVNQKLMPSLSFVCLE